MAGTERQHDFTGHTMGPGRHNAISSSSFLCSQPCMMVVSRSPSWKSSYATTLVLSSAFSDHHTSLFLSLSALQNPWSQILPEFCSWPVLPICYLTFCPRLHIIIQLWVFKEPKTTFHAPTSQPMQNGQRVNSMSLPALPSRCQGIHCCSTLQGHTVSCW